MLTYNTTAYSLYILISLCVTIFVSRTLSKNGVTYLIDGFNGNDDLAKSVNHMLVVGFYLLNLGFVLLQMKSGQQMANVEDVIIYLSSGVGFVLFVLGFAHFFNMYVIHRFREGQTKKDKEPVSTTMDHNLKSN